MSVSQRSETTPPLLQRSIGRHLFSARSVISIIPSPRESRFNSDLNDGVTAK